MSNRFLALIALVCGLAASPVLASNEHVEPAKKYANETLAKWMSDPLIIQAVKAQNEKHKSLKEEQIVALDKKWRAEVNASQRPLVESVLANKVSEYLKSKKESSKGLITEIFVMDNKGLNVGQSDPTSDYWQGDEAKWKNTFLKGADAVFVDDVEKDESTQMYQAQVSISIMDPETKEVIGAVTAGVNVDEL
jgi:uncharacterized protein YcfL